MPNWVRTRIIGADMEALKKALLTEKDGELVADFSKVIPMPEDLKIDSGSFSYDVPSKIFTSEIRNAKALEQQPITIGLKTILGKFIREHQVRPNQEQFVYAAMQDKELIKQINTLKGFDEIKDTGARDYLITYLKGFYNYETYGFTDWYEWSVCNWGTKWNASETVVDETGICFETAWSLAYPIMHELAKITPIRVCYADENIGYNCGMIDFFVNEDGEVEEERLMEESVGLASEVWGYGTVDVYDDETDDWISDETDERFIKAQEEYQEVVDRIDDLMTVDDVISDRVGV